jgi:hypothetical protein
MELPEPFGNDGILRVSDATKCNMETPYWWAKSLISH